ncbi:MAG: MFS transporter [Actinomycetota bacterium]
MAKNSALGSDFSRIWSASLITNLADGVLKLAAPLLAVSLTEDPVLIGLLSALSLLPWLFFAIPIGVYVDRTDRRRALIQGNVLRSIVGIVLAFAIAEDFINIWILLSAIFFIGICEVLVDTTSQSVLPQILDRSEFEKGNSRLQISEVIVAQFVGSPLSGFLYAIAIGLPFFFSTAGFFVAALVIAVLPFKKELSSINPHDVKKEKMGILGDIKFALSFIYREKSIFAIVVVTTSIGFFYSLSNAIAPLFLLKELDIPVRLFGVVLAIQGVGALIGSITAPRISSALGRGRALALNLLLASSMIVLTGLAPNAVVYVVISVVIGFTISIWNILLMSLYQSLIPSHLYGRIHGARRTIVWGLMPLGSVIGGFVAKGGLRLPFLIGGVIATSISVLAFTTVVRIGNQSAEINSEQR